jgi:ABC-type enterochelin transport system substrate-binding protein
LTNTIPPAVLSAFKLSKQLALIAPNDEHVTSGMSSGSSQYAVFKNMLDQLREALKERGALTTEQDTADATSQVPKKAVRIVLHEFGSLDWSDKVSVTVRSGALGGRIVSAVNVCLPAVPRCVSEHA